MDNVVSSDPEILDGTLVFSGTRVPAVSVHQHLERGYTIDYVLEQFPTVLREQVQALLQQRASQNQ
jgi:uncharacterized protein (DUF433 family)